MSRGCGSRPMTGLSQAEPGSAMLRRASPARLSAMISSPMSRLWLSASRLLAQVSTAEPITSLNDSLSAPLWSSV